jgi:hypothetical protein
MITGIAIALALISIPQTLWAGDQELEQVVFYNGIRLYARTADDRALEVALFLEPYQRGKSKPVLRFWGFDKEEPSWIIGEITLRVAGKEAIIPQKAIADLADIVLPGGFYLSTKGDAILLHFSGGDGAGSYHAAFRFIDKRMISRTITFINQEGGRDCLTQNMADNWEPGRP